MGKLIYLLNVSLDGFIETPDHNLDWGTVDDELHTFFNEQMRTTRRHRCTAGACTRSWRPTGRPARTTRRGPM